MTKRSLNLFQSMPGAHFTLTSASPFRQGTPKALSGNLRGRFGRAVASARASSSYLSALSLHYWQCWIKAYVGADATSGLVHMLVGTAGNAADVTQVHTLLYGGETVVLGDDGYQGVEKRIENQGPSMQWHVAMKSTLGGSEMDTR